MKSSWQLVCGQVFDEVKEIFIVHAFLSAEVVLDGDAERLDEINHGFLLNKYTGLLLFNRGRIIFIGLYCQIGSIE